MRPLKFFPILLALALTILVLRPLLGPVWYPVHDTTHIARLHLLETTLMAGQFPPVWADSLSYGLGYPLFHFYAPLFYDLALLCHFFVGSYITALKLALGIFLLVGTLGVMKFSARWGRGAAIMAGVAFIFSPYLAVDLYVRGAFSELAALCLIPWLFLVWEKLHNARAQVVAGIVTSLFLLSHNLLPLVVFPVLLIWVVSHHYAALHKLVLPALLTFLLSASFLLPLIFERHFVQAEQIAKTTDYTLHFVAPTQLWNSTWGFGGSASGVEDGMSFKLGKLQLILAFIGALSLLFRGGPGSWFFPAATFFALFMTTSFSAPIWQLISPLSLIQFPWRYLALAASLLSILVGASLSWFHSRPLRIGWTIFMATGIIFLNLKYFAPQSLLSGSDTPFLSSAYLASVPAIIPEYLPRWMKELPHESPALLMGEGITMISSQSSTNRLSLTFTAAQSTSIVVARTYYPTWQATLNGNNIALSPSPSGLVSFSSPPGTHTLSLRQVPTPLEQFGIVLSLLGFVICVAIVGIPDLREKGWHA